MGTNGYRSARVFRSKWMMSWHALIGAMGLLIATPALARAEPALFDIAAQPLPTALKAFAAQAHMQLLYEHRVVAGATGNAVSGELDKRAALEQLLRDTGLEIIYSSDNAATIRPARETTSEQASPERKTKPTARLRIRAASPDDSSEPPLAGQSLIT